MVHFTPVPQDIAVVSPVVPAARAYELSTKRPSRTATQVKEAPKPAGNRPFTHVQVAAPGSEMLPTGQLAADSPPGQYMFAGQGWVFVEEP